MKLSLGTIQAIIFLALIFASCGGGIDNNDIDGQREDAIDEKCQSFTEDDHDGEIDTTEHWCYHNTEPLIPMGGMGGKYMGATECRQAAVNAGFNPAREQEECSLLDRPHFGFLIDEENSSCIYGIHQVKLVDREVDYIELGSGDYYCYRYYNFMGDECGLTVRLGNRVPGASWNEEMKCGELTVFGFETEEEYQLHYMKNLHFEGYTFWLRTLEDELIAYSQRVEGDCMHEFEGGGSPLVSEVWSSSLPSPEESPGVEFRYTQSCDNVCYTFSAAYGMAGYYMLLYPEEFEVWLDGRQLERSGDQVGYFLHGDSSTWAVYNNSPVQITVCDGRLIQKSAHHKSETPLCSYPASVQMVRLAAGAESPFHQYSEFLRE